MSPSSQTNKSEHRPISDIDQVFFENSQANLSGIIVLPSKKKSKLLGVTSSDTKLKGAFKNVVKNVPILQTNVVGDGDDAFFQKIAGDHQSDVSPSFTVESDVQKTKMAMMKRARSILSELKLILSEGGKDAYRQSIRIRAVRCPKAIAYVFIVPHHFTDGTGVSSIFTQLNVMQLLPKFTWRLLRAPPGSQRMQLPPSFNEMALKRSVAPSEIKSIDVYSDSCFSPKYTRDHFCFVDYDAASPNAINELRGMHGELAKASAKSLKKTLQALKKDGISLTSAFDALAVKVLSRLIANNQPSQLSSYAPILGTSAIDGRNMKKVISSKEKRHRARRPIFPVVGNFAFSHDTLVPFEDALNQPLHEIAKMYKNGFRRLQIDETYRLHNIAACTASSSISCPQGTPFCGTSSVLSPRILQRTGLNISSEIRIDFGPIPRCWFYAISHGSRTVIAADIHVPLPQLTEEIVRRTIFDVSRGTALEYLFASRITQE